MPEETVTIHVNEDGTPNLDKFVDHPALSKVKQLVDGLRGSNDKLKTQVAETRERLDAFDDLEKRAKRADTLQAKIDKLQEAAAMTDAEKTELETLRERAKLLDELGDPAELKKKLARYPELEQQVRETERRDRVQKAAGDAYNTKALLKFLPADAELEQVGEGDEAKWVVKHGDNTTPLNDFVTGIESDLGISLQTKPQRATIGGGSNPGDSAPKDFRSAPQEEVNAEMLRLGINPTRY